MHSYFHIRTSPEEIAADVDRVDLLCTFDAESIVRHVWEVTPGGGVVCDTDALKTRISEISTLSPTFWDEFRRTLEERGITPESVGDLLNEVEKKDGRVFAIPYTELLKEVGHQIGEDKLSRLTRMTNVLALGASFGPSQLRQISCGKSDQRYVSGQARNHSNECSGSRCRLRVCQEDAC